jgi:hypothetical protein
LTKEAEELLLLMKDDDSMSQSGLELITEQLVAEMEASAAGSTTEYDPSSLNQESNADKYEKGAASDEESSGAQYSFSEKSVALFSEKSGDALHSASEPSDAQYFSSEKSGAQYSASEKSSGVQYSVSEPSVALHFSSEPPCPLNLNPLQRDGNDYDAVVEQNHQDHNQTPRRLRTTSATSVSSAEDNEYINPRSTSTNRSTTEPMLSHPHLDTARYLDGLDEDSDSDAEGILAANRGVGSTHTGTVSDVNNVTHASFRLASPLTPKAREQQDDRQDAIANCTRQVENANAVVEFDNQGRNLDEQGRYHDGQSMGRHSDSETTELQPSSSLDLLERKASDGDKWGTSDHLAGTSIVREYGPGSGGDSRQQRSNDRDKIGSEVVMMMNDEVVVMKGEAVMMKGDVEGDESRNRAVESTRKMISETPVRCITPRSIITQTNSQHDKSNSRDLCLAVVDLEVEEQEQVEALDRQTTTSSSPRTLGLISHRTHLQKHSVSRPISATASPPPLSIPPPPPPPRAGSPASPRARSVVRSPRSGTSHSRSPRRSPRPPTSPKVSCSSPRFNVREGGVIGTSDHRAETRIAKGCDGDCVLVSELRDLVAKLRSDVESKSMEIESLTDQVQRYATRGALLALRLHAKEM